MSKLVGLLFILLCAIGVYAQPANDNIASATAITHSSNNCSADAAYTTVSATADGSAGSCWENGPNYTVWFSFVATTAEVTLDLKVGASEGTLDHPNLALWQSDASTEIACVRRVDASTDVQISTSGLTIGNTYYVSVDNYVGASYTGTFTLCIDDQVNYNEPGGATVIIHSTNNCSADGAYSTVNASADGSAGSCWENGPNYNRWFQFVATTANVTLDLKVNGVSGKMDHPNMALWESDASTQIACVRRVDASTDVQISATGLTIGNTYYVSVDNYVGLSYRGNFTLCIDDQATYDHPAGAIVITHTSNNCSADGAYSTINASADGSAGSCWENGPNYNRWFQFVATTANVTLDLKVNGVSGKMDHPNMALWESDASTEVACVRRVDASTDVQISAIGLTIGNTYYVSVDNYVGLSYRGNFTLCIDDQATYDHPVGAIVITHTSNNCSADGAYSTVNASADGSAGSCWENGPNYNRWFQFVATTANVTLDLKVNGVSGKMDHPNMALWESDASTQISCVRRVDASTDVQISATGLTIGNTYFVSVDNYVGLSYRGNFTLCIDDQATFDQPIGAVTLIHTGNNCSADGAYTTINATADGSAGSCWENGPNYNVWFKFVATTANVTLDLKVNGVSGKMDHPNMALWESDASTQISCVRRVDASTDVQISTSGLTIGQTYYVSVDNYVGNSYRGNFTICIDDQVNYDEVAGAIELTDLNNWCSADGEYSTVNGTADGSAGSCWENGPNYTRWFKFTAVTANVTLQMKVNGVAGKADHPNIALWESDATTQVGCTRRVDASTDISLSSAALVVGNEYYISCDNYVGLSYRGNFTLCIDNLDIDYYSIADGDWATASNWSIVSHAGPAAASFPNAGDIANIQDNTITVSGSEVCGEVNIVDGTAVSALDISAGTLVVAGKVTMQNSGANFDSRINVTGGGSLTINDNLTATRAGGANSFFLNIENNSSVSINKDLEFASSSGTTVNNLITLNGNATLTVGQDLKLNNTGGIKTFVQLNGTSSLTVDRDIEFTASADDRNEIELNSSSTLSIKRSVVRGSPAYGILTSNGSATVLYNGSSNAQDIAAGGSGTGDTFQYENLTINNSRPVAPQLTIVGGNLSVPSQLTLTDGIISTTASTLMILEDGSTTSSGSANSFIDGPMRKVGNAAYTFHVGDGSTYAPIGISAPTLSTDHFTAEYTESIAHPTYDSAAKEVSLHHVSGCEYWTLDRTNGTSSVAVTLSWNTRSCGVSTISELTIARWDGSEWKDHGNNLGLITGNASSGTLTSSSAITSFSPFTLGSTTAANSLPIELAEFDARLEGNEVNLSWITETEINNDYFTIERSRDAVHFEEVSRVHGAGNSNRRMYYSAIDYQPYSGISYYRLRQTDYDGTTADFPLKAINNRVGGRNSMFCVFPNPCLNGEINIRFPQDNLINDNIQVALMDVFGKVVYSEQITYDGEENPIITLKPSTVIPSGVYTLTTTIQGKFYSELIIIK